MDIKIDITDDRLFADVAPVVDRDKFSKEIGRIRTVVGISTLLPQDKYNQFAGDEGGRRRVTKFL